MSNLTCSPVAAGGGAASEPTTQRQVGFEASEKSGASLFSRPGQLACASTSVLAAERSTSIAANFRSAWAVESLGRS